MGSMAAVCVSRGSAALHRLLNILRPYGALPDGNMFDFEDIGLFSFAGAKVQFFLEQCVQNLKKLLEFNTFYLFFNFACCWHLETEPVVAINIGQEKVR